MIVDSIHITNVGWLVGGILLLAGVIAPRIVGRDSGLTAFPPYTPRETIWLRLQLLDLLALVIVSVFTPLAHGVTWIAAGLALYTFGAAIYILALRVFAQTPDEQLVTGGVFRLNRNPVYTGQIAMLLGAGIAGASPPLIALGVGFALLVDRLVRAEERMCAESFGAAYADYAAQVPRWLGG